MTGVACSRVVACSRQRVSCVRACVRVPRTTGPGDYTTTRGEEGRRPFWLYRAKNWPPGRHNDGMTTHQDCRLILAELLYLCDDLEAADPEDSTRLNEIATEVIAAGHAVFALADQERP